MLTRKITASLLALTLGLLTFVSPKASMAAGVVGTGTAGSCTEAALDAALVNGGSVTFNCGSGPVAIPITTSKATTTNTTINGGGRISLVGGTTSRVFYVRDGATLNLSNITIRDTGEREFSIGLTMHNDGIANLVNVTFLNNNYRALFNGGGTMTIIGSRFEDNTSSAFGSAISNEAGGTVTIRDSIFINNRTNGSFEGGAIYNNDSSRMDIFRTRFIDNYGGVGGGAITNFGTMNINDSEFSNNRTDGSGGAIVAHSDAALNITNTTISGNTARRGGGIYGVGPIASNAATLTNVTLANNITPTTAANQGGANITLNGLVTITLRNTLIVSSDATLDNCVNATTENKGRIINGGNNLQFPGTSCNDPRETSIPTADPKIGALADNGGFTLTHAIAADSPARNTANNAVCPGFDQRGVVRPQAGTCDIGAFEYGAIPVLTKINQACGQARGRASTLTVSGSNFIEGAKGSKIILNGTPLATTFVSPTQLSAVVPAGFLTGTPGSTVPVIVQTPTVDGGTSVVRLLTICYSTYIPMVQK